QKQRLSVREPVALRPVLEQLVDDIEPRARQRALERVQNPVPDRSREERVEMAARAARDAQGGHPVKAFFVMPAYYLKGENT
ncbi:hypothetical protein NO135_23070, partial [Clostridioides difficile]|nr:hypothetical protein [Clostridioides difficile]